MYAGTIVAALCERLVWCEVGVVRVLDVPLVHGPDPVWSALQSQGHPVW
jgi:hypothetical protein